MPSYQDRLGCLVWALLLAGCVLFWALAAWAIALAT